MKKTSLPNNLEIFLKVLGNEGCYVLCLIDVAEEYLHTHIDIVEAIQKGVRAGYIKYNPDDELDRDNMFVTNPSGFLYLITNKTWFVRIASIQDEIKKDEYVINCYVKGKKKHFERDNFKPIIHSITVAEGNLDSRRLLKVVP